MTWCGGVMPVVGRQCHFPLVAPRGPAPAPPLLTLLLPPLPRRPQLDTQEGYLTALPAKLGSLASQLGALASPLSSWARKVGAGARGDGLAVR